MPENYSKRPYNYEIPNRKIVLVNLLIDIKRFFKINFQNNSRGYIGLGFFSIYLINRKRPYVYNIRNNFEFSNNLITKNKTIRVNVIKNSIEQHYINENIEINKKLSFRFTYSLGFRQINAIYEKFSKISKNFINQKNLKQIIETKNTNESKIKEKCEVEILKGIEVYLSGVKDVNKEGRLLSEKLLFDNFSRVYIQFNQIIYMDKPEIYCWIYVKNKKYSWKKINLNVFLIKQGLAKVNQIKLNDIYDERIYYNFSDLIDAERIAKERGKGIWSRYRSGVVRESSVLNDGLPSIFDRLKVKTNMKIWQKSILNK